MSAEVAIELTTLLPGVRPVQFLDSLYFCLVQSRETPSQKASSQEASSQSAGQKAAEEAEAPTDSAAAAAAAAVLEVEDSGIGMDPSVAERLFEPFRQASEGMSREYEGTGIGLAVTKKATEEMGGSIEVDTQKGEGSRFTVRFPAARSAGNAGGPPAGGAQQADQPPAEEEEPQERA